MPEAGATQTDVLIVGGGMAGLAAALAVRQTRPELRLDLLEQAEVFSEVGAGIQLGPNAVRVLRDWGLEAALRSVAAFPSDLRVRDARSGRALGALRLGDRAVERYGAPYATIHRADLHRLLLDAVNASGGVSCHLRQRIETVQAEQEGVSVSTNEGTRWQARTLLGCDGLWSRVRERVWGDEPARFSGHLAYRGMVRMADVAAGGVPSDVCAWLGPRMHAVHYPVRRGEWLNVVVVVHGEVPAGPAGWDHQASAESLRRAVGVVAPDLQRVLEAVSGWRLWPLFGRLPVAGPEAMAQGSVALLGDAAHPMRPYLAQGAAMALEDAWTLGRLLSSVPAESIDWSSVLRQWAGHRWRRCAWVQARSQRNGAIFHADGWMRWGRDTAMACLGERLLDVPRLYTGPTAPG